jgi:hypothetical protein
MYEKDVEIAAQDIRAIDLLMTEFLDKLVHDRLHLQTDFLAISDIGGLYEDQEQICMVYSVIFLEEEFIETDDVTC